MTDTPPPDRDRTAELEARIAELERRSWRQTVDQGRTGVEEAFWALMHRLFPDEARKHLKVAGREQLMAARVYIDKWIERLDEEEAEAERTREKIEIE
jgi:hypothetical protein